MNNLLDSMASETDAKKRLSLASDSQKYLLDHAYVIPIFEEPQVYAGAPYVHDMGFEAVGRPSFYSTWMAKH
jgi:peptide/nickel transport system substrate-binding protein